jgi:CHAD domain-containing protein
MPATAGFQRIAWNVLGQLLSAYPLVLKDGSPEGVHQSRVALRRLRSAIRLFGPLVRDEQMPVLRAALGTAARGLGKARDLFVLAETIAAVPSAAGPDSTEVSDHLVASLAAATADAQAVLASAPFQRLLFELATWVEAGNWLDQAAPTDLRTFAAHAIGRARRRLLRRGLDLAALDEEARHEVRKDAKQLRYAVGFLETLWPQPALRKDKARFARELARLQDSLGMLNDLAVAADHESLFTDLDPITAARLGARVETLVGTRSDSRRKLLRKAEKALARIAETHPWWKHR